MNDTEARLLADALRRHYLAKTDLLLTREGDFPPVDIVADLSVQRTTPELIYDGRYGVGIFIQTVSSEASCTLRVNRLDGATYDPHAERIYVGEPIRRLWLTNNVARGVLKLRIHTNPSYTLSISPTEEALMQAVYSLRSSGVSRSVSVTMTSTQLPSVAVPFGSKVRLWASSANTARVHFNIGSEATTANAALAPGEGVDLQITNTDLIHLIAASGTQAVNYLVLT